MTKIANTTDIDTSIPAFLKRETNTKGVTLSGGVVATGSKIAKKVVDQTTASKPVAVKKAKFTGKRKEAAAQEAKAAATLLAQEVGEEQRAAKAAAPKAPKAPKLPKTTKVTAEPAVGPDGQPLVKVSRSIVPMKFKAKYAKNNGVCGDDVSLELKAATTTLNADKRETLDVAALWDIAKANQIDVTKYLPLNNGQKRMNVGNKLRGRLAAGDDVVIGKRTFKAEDFTPRH